MNDSFYRDFEDRYRGSREVIKSRLRVYVPFIASLTALHQPATAIDLGCGRGEWLELLGDIGVDAHGVDLDEGMLAACHERGLRATKADAIKTLQELPDNSATLVSAFHLVEHISFEALQILVSEALRVLKSGGLLIMETPNPENLTVGASDFYLDPSHMHPIPATLLSFVTEHAGFHRNKVVRLQESPELHTAALIGLSSVLNGASPDYGVIAQKSANAEALSGFDEPFQAGYGISLVTLAERYDAQAESRNAEVHKLLAQVEARAVHNHQQTANRISHIEHRLTQAEVRAGDAEVRAGDAEVRAGDAEARAVDLGARLLAVLDSRSWRITAPLRSAGDYYYRTRASIKEAKARRKERMQVLLRQLRQALARKAGLKRFLRWTLDRVPGFKSRLRSMMHKETNSATGPNRSGALSPRASRIYAELKKAIEARKR